jgi:hypothetical protein
MLPTGGMRTDKSVDNLAQDEWAFLSGVHIVAGKLVVDTGYAMFAGAFSGQAQRVFQAFLNDGASVTMLVTTTTVYIYSSTAQQWQLASYYVLYQTTASAAAGASSFALNRLDGLSNGAIVGIDLSDGSQLITTITSIPALTGGTGGISGTTLTLSGGGPFTNGDYVTGAGVTVGTHITAGTGGGPYTVAPSQTVPGGTQLYASSSLTITTATTVPTALTAPSGTDVSLAVPLSGNAQTNQVQALIFPGNDWIIFTNGISPVLYYYQGVVQELPGLPTNTTCQTLAVFHDLLLLGDTTENGTHFPHRVRQSDQGNPAEWTPGTGITAIYDLFDTDDAIQCLKTLGPWCICYRGQSIMRATYLGVLNEILYWEYMVGGVSEGISEGAQSQGAVADIGSGRHLFVGISGVYVYRGGYELQSVGDGVFNNFLAPTGDFYAPAAATLFVTYVPDLNEAWVFYPSKSVQSVLSPPTLPTKMLRLWLAGIPQKQAWFERVFAAPIASADPFYQTEGTTWAAATGQWDSPQWNITWESAVFVQNEPSFMLSLYAATQMFVYDYGAPTDNGAVISWEMTSRQIGDGGEFSRWDRVVAVGQGEGAIAIWSQDEFNTATAIGTFEFGATPSAQWEYVDQTATRFQIDLSGADPMFSLRYIDVFSELDSEW